MTTSQHAPAFDLAKARRGCLQHLPDWRLLPPRSRDHKILAMASTASTGLFPPGAAPDVLASPASSHPDASSVDPPLAADTGQRQRSIASWPQRVRMQLKVPLASISSSASLKVVMKKFLAVVLSGCASIVAYCAEPVASIESADLRPLPGNVGEAIAGDASFKVFKSLSCDVQGKTVALSPGSPQTIWFATTAKSCGWGVALGPIWLVQVDASGKAALVLYSGGYSLYPSKTIHNGRPDVVIDSGGGAGEFVETIRLRRKVI
jgi:hypothetical protein